jgi:hypothetical protein
MPRYNSIVDTLPPCSSQNCAQSEGQRMAPVGAASSNRRGQVRSRMTMSKGRLLIRDIDSPVGGNSSVFFSEPRFCRQVGEFAKFAHRNHLGECANDLVLPRRSDPRGTVMNNPQKHGLSRGVMTLPLHWSRWHPFSRCL